MRLVCSQSESVMPDTEEFGSLEASLALDACGLLLESLSAILQKDSVRLSSIAHIPIAAAEMRIRVEKIDTEELIYLETQFQENLLAELRKPRLSTGFFE